MDLHKQLSPREAALAADAVYRIRNNATASLAAKEYRDLGNLFALDGSATRCNAKSGAFAIKVSSGFAVLAKGKGPYEGHALLACRGTKDKHDVLTDLNAGIQVSSSGSKVHAGFNRTFNCFSGNINEWVSKNRPQVIHCVGHSLGGALANLCAADIIKKPNCPWVNLYTFGSPRVGDAAFAKKLSEHPKMGIRNIHRVYHGGDPISMVPLWPFVHAPQPGGECYVGKLLGFNPAQHMMGRYLDSIDGHKRWKSLRQPQPNFSAHCLEWLTSSTTYAFGGLNFYNLAMLSQAISLVVKKSLTIGMSSTGGLAVVSSATILDHLSYMLEKSAKVSEENSTLVSCILKRVLALCGIEAKANMSITRQFIRYVFVQLNLAINRAANTAIMLAHNVGL